jgi:hypothetical protein
MSSGPAKIRWVSIQNLEARFSRSVIRNIIPVFRGHFRAFFDAFSFTRTNLAFSVLDPFSLENSGLHMRFMGYNRTNQGNSRPAPCGPARPEARQTAAGAKAAKRHRRKPIWRSEK